MTMPTVIVPIVAASPILCFAIAATMEFRQDRGSLRSVVRALPLAIGGGAAVLFFVPIDSYLPSTTGSFLFSRILTITSILVAACGVLCRFNSRLAAALVVIGGAVLAFFWLDNFIVD